MAQYLDKTGLTHLWDKLKERLAGKANGNSVGTALKTEGIPFGEVDSTSTATAYTATVAGVSELKDGTVVMLRNGVVTSASGFTINVNGLGAKPVYSNLATGNATTPTAPTRDTTIFNINYTMMFVYQSDLVDGGAWICFRGYDANTNTIGYQLRTNSGSLAASDTGYRYRLWFTSADGTNFVPMTTSTATNATTARTLNARPIDPFGKIVYNSTNGTVTAGARPAVGTLWEQYAVTIGYSYVKSLTAWLPVYLKCTPQPNGSAMMNDVVQALPSAKDGYIYIFLGIAYSATAMELNVEHPVYYHDGTGIRIWTGAEASGGAAVEAMTNAEIESAVESGWGATYNISFSGDFADYCHAYPSTIRETAEVSPITKAVSGDTVVIRCDPMGVGFSANPSVEIQQEPTPNFYAQEMANFYSFKMPDSDIVINTYHESPIGGDDDEPLMPD